MAVRFHRFLAYLVAAFPALAGLFQAPAYAERSSGTSVTTAQAAAGNPAATTAPKGKAARRDSYYRAETKVLGDVARVIGKFKLTPPQRLAVMNYIGHSNRGLKVVSFGRHGHVERFALKNAKTDALLGVIGVRTTKDHAVIVDKATYATLDYKKYVPLPLKGKLPANVAASTLKDSKELPLLQKSLKKSKRSVALPGLRPIPGLDFANARQCTARFNADGSGAEYCLVSKPASRLAGTAKPAAATSGKPAAVAAAPVMASTRTRAAEPTATPAPTPTAPVVAPSRTHRPAAPAVQAPVAPASNQSHAPMKAATGETTALVGAVTYFSRPTVDRAGRQMESGISSRYQINDSLPHYEYHYSKPAESAPPPSARQTTKVINETNIYEEETEVLEEDTTIVQEQTNIIEVLPASAGAPEGTDFTPVEDEPAAQTEGGIPETGGILPPEEEAPAEEPTAQGPEPQEEQPQEPQLNPQLNFDEEDTGEGYGIPGLPGIYTGGPRDEEPDALKHDMEEHDYEQALDKGTQEAMDTFMKEHPDSEQADYERALQSGDPAALEQYVEEHPDSPEAQAATNELQLGDDQEDQSQFNDTAAPQNETPAPDTPTY